MKKISTLICILLLAGFKLALAKEAQTKTIESVESKDKNQYHLFNPTPKSLMRELTTDRPDKTESPITVDAGHFQMETDLVILSFDKAKAVEGATGITTTTWTRSASFNVMNLKAGVTNWMDFQAIIESFTTKTTKIEGASDTKSGFGDTTLRWKFNFMGNEGGPVALGVMPLLKIPTNQDRRGNKKLEPGVIFPSTLELPADISMGFMFQWNLIKNDANRNYHNEMISSLTFGHDIIGTLGGYVEFFSKSSDDVDAKWVATADFGLTWGITPNIQLDLGLNLGVTKLADDYNPFLGLTTRL